jgi:hypothetical protein
MTPNAAVQPQIRAQRYFVGRNWLLDRGFEQAILLPPGI